MGVLVSFGLFDWNNASGKGDSSFEPDADSINIWTLLYDIPILELVLCNEVESEDSLISASDNGAGDGGSGDEPPSLGQADSWVSPVSPFGPRLPTALSSKMGLPGSTRR